MLVVVAGAAAFVLTRPEDSSGPDQAGGPTTPTPNQTTPSPAFTRYAGDLEPLLLPVPSGAEGAQISFLEPGMTDAERISALWNPDEPTGLLGALERYRFVRGTDRAWTQGQEFVVVAILQFADPQRAREWYTFASTGAVAGLDTQGEIAGVSNGHYAVKVAELWSLPPSYPEGRDAMIDQLRRHRFQACVHRYWEGGACGCGQSSLVTRFATERDAEAIAAWLERELTGREFVAVGTFDFAAVSRWVETDYAGPRSLTGLFARGPYVGFVQLGPDDDGDRAVFEALARQQYDLLSPG